MDSPNFVEHLVKRKGDSSLLLKKLAIVFGTAIVVGLLVALALKPLIAIIPFVLAAGGALVWYLWRYVSIEYEYTIVSGEMDFDIIYGQRKRKRVFEARIKDFELVAPVSEKFQHRLGDRDISVRLNCCSSLNSPDLYFIIYNDPKQGKTLVIFDMIPKALKVIRFYNPSALTQ